MAALVTLAEAQTELRQPNPAFAADIGKKAEMASELVIDYIKRPDHGWTDETVPLVVKAAILAVLQILYDEPNGDPLNGNVRRMLHRFRDPALA
jgi:hypothetical protein